MENQCRTNTGTKSFTFSFASGKETIQKHCMSQHNQNTLIIPKETIPLIFEAGKSSSRYAPLLDSDSSVEG